MSAGLLDVNMLIALAWPNHVHHRIAQAWFSRHASAGWATCPLTQCGFIRISSNPRIISEAVSPREAQLLLRTVTAHRHHQFWADDIPFHAESIPVQLLLGHQQVTDAYLLGLSLGHKGKLVTLDAGIAALLPPGSPHLRAIELVSTAC